MEERRILSLFATGLVVTEVAEALNLAPEAVRAMRASAIAKLGARSTLEAIILAIRADFVCRPGR